MKFFDFLNKCVDGVIERKLGIPAIIVEIIIVFISAFFSFNINSVFVLITVVIFLIFMVAYMFIGRVITHGIYYLFGTKKIKLKDVYFKFLVFDSLITIVSFIPNLLFNNILRNFTIFLLLGTVLKLTGFLISVFYYCTTLNKVYNASKTVTIVWAVICLFPVVFNSIKSFL